METLNNKNVELSKHRANVSCKEIEQPSTSITTNITGSNSRINIPDDMPVVKCEELAQDDAKTFPVVSPCVLQINQKCPRKGKTHCIVSKLMVIDVKTPKNKNG